MKTQYTKILNHFLTGRKLSHLGAFQLYGSLGGWSKRISEIRQHLRLEYGIDLADNWVTQNGKTFKSYYINKKDIKRILKKKKGSEKC